MLTARQHQLLLYIDSRLRQSGVSPSFEEMKEAIGLKSKSGVHRLIGALEERRFLRRLPNRARALEVLRLPDDAGTPAASAAMSRGRRQAPPVLVVPLVGRIAAGLPIEAIEQPEPLPVPAALLGPGEHYALQVVGDSMADAGILDGDFALVRKADTARDGEIVVALIDDSDATLKYFHHDAGMIRLDPANPAWQPQRYPPSRVRIQGRLAGLLRRY